MRFWADGKIFETLDYSFETVHRRLQEMAFLNKGLTINFTDERVAATDATEEELGETAEAPKTAEARMNSK